MKFALIANPQRYEVKEIVTSSIKWAEKNDVELLISRELYENIKPKKAKCVTIVEDDKEAIEKCNYIVVIGGDGSILYTGRLSTHQNKPVLGVNSGRLGFMTDTQPEDLEKALDHLLNGEFTVDKRHYLKATDKKGNEYYALNEFLFTRRESTSMINISAYYDNDLINTYWADGLIVASSTGSTAYNLSSGGPIVVPGTGVFVLTPISPHTLTTRPLVMLADKPLKIVIDKHKPSEIVCSFDGVTKEIESAPFEIEIVKSELTFDIVHLPGQSYFETLRKKLMWGQDSRRT